MNRIIELESVVQDNRHAGRNNGGILMSINDQSRVLVSAPHSILTYRYGDPKLGEVNTYGIARHLNEETGCSIITLDGGRQLDPNSHADSLYRYLLFDVCKLCNIRYFIDLHGCLNRDPYFDILVANNYGETDDNLDYQKFLEDRGLILEYNTHFHACSRTLVHYVHDKLKIPSVELELSAAFRYSDKIPILVDYIKYIEGRVKL